ncbi:MAG: hypothetical protein FJZ63_02205, partial [Chlamydiae bacterium]|nr:hypothetical protein [Chlamydiota bacterium]
MVAKKRAYIFGFILLLLCSGVVFHKPLICLGFKKVIRKMPLFAKGKISYEQLGLTKEGLYLEGVVVEGFAHLQIEKVEALWKSTGFLRFECSYKVTQPTLILDVEKCKILTSRPLYDLFSSSFFSKKLTLEKGEVVFLGKEYQENLFFSCRVGGSRQHLGTMHCGFEKGVQQLRLDLYKNAQELVLDVEMQKAPLAPLLQLASDLNPKKSKWRMQEGCASGTFRLGITKEYKLHQLHTQLALEECKVESVASHGMLQLKAARFEAYLPQEKEDKIDLAATGVGEMFQTLVSKSSWEGGELIHIQPSTQKLWKLEGMKGTFFFEENRAPELVFEAILGEEGNKYPLSIQGQGLTMSENSWWMEFGCSLGVNLKQPMQISMYVALLESQEMCIKTSFQDLGGVELRMIQSWLQLFCPKLQEIDILGGKITTDITLHLFNNKLQSIALDKVHVQELTAKKIGTSWKIFCQGVQGRGKWFFPSMKYLKAPSWDISFQKLVFQHEDQPTWTISYEGYLASHDNQIDPSWIKASLPGIEAACFIRGPYPSIELSAEIAFAEEHIFSPFQQEVLQVASHIKPLNKIDLACKLVQGAEEMHLLGSTHLYYEGGTRDSVRFGSQMTKLLSPSTWKGWFQSEAVSENTYLGFLKYFRQKWYALGALHVTGEWDTGSLRFKLMSHEVTYDSEDIQIMMPRREEMHQGDFTFDRMHNQWHIFLPVKKACCQDKKVFLPFKDVDAEVTLEGLELKANILSATCENVAFAGRVEVAFSRPEWTVLKLYPETFHADSSDFMRFLGHLPEFKQIQLPWKGVIESVGYNEMKIGYNGERSEKETKLGIKIDGAEYSFNPFASLKELQCLLTWDSVQGFLEIKEVKGSLHLQREQEERTYRLNVQNLVSKNIFQKEWDFDVRIEAPTLDILRVVGTTAACERGWQLELKEDLTHFFGTKLALQGCKFT